METALSALVGLFFVAAIYLMLSKHIIRMLLGIALFGNAVNLLIFTAGRIAERGSADHSGRARRCRPARPPIRCRRR